MSTTNEQIATHLEFLGYEIEKIKPTEEGGKEITIAKHSKKNNIAFFELQPEFILFKVNLTTTRKHNQEMDSVVNNANRIFNLSRFYYEIDKDSQTAILRFEAVYTGEYSKTIFGQFIDFFVSDQDSLYNVENFNKSFLDEK